MSRLLERFGTTWGDAARDVVLIVVSILVAFALDAWWDGLKEQRDQSEQIVTLLSEFEAASDSLTLLSRNLDEAGQATDNLLTLMGADAAEPDLEEFLEQLQRTLNFGGLVPNNRALVAVLTEGNPLIEHNASLMALLGNWPAQMEDIKGDFAHLERNRDVDLQAALIQVGIRGIAVTPAVLQILDLPPPSFSLDAQRLVRICGRVCGAVVPCAPDQGDVFQRCLGAGRIGHDHRGVGARVRAT